MLFSCFILHKYVMESEGLLERGLNTELYQKEESNIKKIFVWLELAPLLELLHHLVGIQKMKTHIFIGMAINIWILFGVINFNDKVRE